ncbi:MAG: trigger factor, partial [Anaerovoracaceae bacterium]
GFEEQLIGVKVDEERDVNVTFPKEYHSEELAGADAIFKCKIYDIKEEELPALDDELAKEASEFDTLEEWKESIKEELKTAKTANAKMQMQNAVLEKVYEANVINVPNAMVEDEIDGMMQEMDQQLRAQGMDLQKYFEMMKKDPKDFREEVKEDAFRRVKTRMIVSKVAEQEKIEVSEEEREKEIEMMAVQYGLEVEKIKEMLGEENLSYIDNDIKARKAMDYMFELAKFK